jgi:heme/copper-type cytochrome/quinol oxidase subunit 1
VCIATTVIGGRTAGMSLHRVPLFSWSMLVASFVWLVTLPVLIANLTLAYVDFRNGRVLYGDAAAIRLQVDWVFWQPQIYACAIPVLGVMSEIVPVAARVRQRMHEVQLVGIALFGLLSMGAFAQSYEVQDNFLYPAVGIAALLPLLIVLGGWGDSLSQGKPSTKGPLGALLLSTVAVLMLFAAVASGALRVIDPFDLIGTSADDGVFTLALLAAIAGGMAGAVYWSAKLTGRLVPEGIARTLALPLLGGIALAGIPDVVSGFLDQPGGDFVGDVKDGVDVLNVVSLIGVLLVALAALGFLLAYAKTLVAGPRYAPNNPWQGHTLEWATVSPPPVGNFGEPLPVVRSERPLLDPAEPAATGGAA